jgi:hypothetical protein
MTARAPAAVAMRYVAWAVLIAAFVWGGWLVRVWTFDVTKPIRFHGDVENAVAIGRLVVMNAAMKNETVAPTRPATVEHLNSLRPNWPQLFSSYLGTYDAEYRRALAKGEFVDSTFRLDYPPGRLLVVSAWCKLVADGRGLVFRYGDDMVAPMLAVNTLHELLAAAGAGALVWQALRRSGATPFAAEALALWAGALLWFNPALILDAHGWPQWDAWVLPYTLWAAFFAMRDRWLASGALLALGALFKGQVLLIAPLFLLWPLYRLRIDAAVRLVIGMTATFAIAMSPWLVFRGDAFAIWWAAVAIVLTSALAFWPRRGTFGIAWWIVATAALGWLALASVGAGAIAFPLAVLMTALLAGIAAFWRRRRFAICLASTALIVFGAGVAFDASFAWLHVGFQTDRYPVLHQGNTVNLPAILERFYSYGSDSPLMIGETTYSLRKLLRGLAYAGLAVAALGVALRERSRDANLLVGFVAAWVVLYALMPQMHERYLVWAAATSAMLAARSVGGFLLHVTLTALQSAMLLCSMIGSAGMTNDPRFGELHFALRGLVPAAGWSTLTLSGVLLVWSFARSRPRVIDTAGTSPAAA